MDKNSYVKFALHTNQHYIHNYPQIQICM